MPEFSDDVQAGRPDVLFGCPAWIGRAGCAAMLFGRLPGFRNYSEGRNIVRACLDLLWSAGEHICEFGLFQFPRHGGIEGLPVCNTEILEQTAHPVPKLEDSLTIIACLLKQPATVLLHLVYQKSEHGERRENVRQMDVSMVVVMLEVVYIPCLQCFECLVLDGPSAATSSHDRHYRTPIKGKVGDHENRLVLPFVSISLYFCQS